MEDAVGEIVALMARCGVLSLCPPGVEVMWGGTIMRGPLRGPSSMAPSRETFRAWWALSRTCTVVTRTCTVVNRA